MPPKTCPDCGASLDSHTSVTGGRPIVGALAVCAYCGAVLEFIAGLEMRLVPAPVIGDAPEHIQRLVAVLVRAVRQNRHQRN